MRNASCPTCGGPIEFKLGASQACVCSYCRSSVLRRGLALESLGKVAELTPTTPFLAVGDSGEVAGRAFTVVGRLQLDHGRGPWDEWYVQFAGGRWGWIAHAQGQVYVTAPVEIASVPSWEEVEPGAQVLVPEAGNVPFVVSERSGSAVLSAEGELPFAVDPQGSGRYADMERAGGEFATLDFGDGQEPPVFYVGKRYPQDALSLASGRVLPRVDANVEAERLRCPKCGGPVPILVPDKTERAACPSCDALLDYKHGALQFLEQLHENRLQYPIPLGSAGTLRGEQVTVIGVIERCTFEDGVRYAWLEYLLHGVAGYRYLVESKGHYVHMVPASVADVRFSDKSARYEGNYYRRFTGGTVGVSKVHGEFFWQVRANDLAEAVDYVAPPFMLSTEETDGELVVSHGEYVPAQEVWEALSLPGQPPHPQGIAPCQPNPHRVGRTALVASILWAVLTAVALFGAHRHHEPQVVNLELNVPDSPYPTPTSDELIQITEPFDVRNGPTTLEVSLKTSVSNLWLGLEGALVNEDTGEVREFYLMAEEWHGVSGGERWSEGGPHEDGYLGGVQTGRYSMRFRTQWGLGPGSAMIAPRAVVQVAAGYRSAGLYVLSTLLLWLPLLWAVGARVLFEARRWADSENGSY